MPKVFFFFPVPKTLGLVLNMDISPGSRSRMNKIPAIAYTVGQLTPRPLINLLLRNFRGMFGELRLFLPYPKQKARFENICFKEKLFYAGNLKIYARDLRTIIGAKLCQARFRD